MRNQVLALLSAGLAMTGAAQAAPVTYQLVDVVFGDGAGTTATGTFTYDEGTGAFGDISITLGTTEITELAGAVSGDVVSAFETGGSVAGAAYLQLSFTVPLSAEASLVQLGLSAASYTTFFAFCQDSGSGACNLTGGAGLVSGAVLALRDPATVPTPTPVWMFLAGLGAILSRRRPASPA